MISNFEEGVVAERLRSILRGEQTIKHHMQFLIKNNHTDMLILKQMKDSVRTASAHNATVIANGLMHLGTTTDDFLRWVIFCLILIFGISSFISAVEKLENINTCCGI